MTKNSTKTCAETCFENAKKLRILHNTTETVTVVNSQKNSKDWMTKFGIWRTNQEGFSTLVVAEYQQLLFELFSKSKLWY